MCWPEMACASKPSERNGCLFKALWAKALLFGKSDLTCLPVKISVTRAAAVLKKCFCEVLYVANGVILPMKKLKSMKTER